MKAWIIGGTAAGLIGAGIYFTTTKPGTPAPVQQSAPPAPVVEHSVGETRAPSHPLVEVAGLDDLLDPPVDSPPAASTAGPTLILVGYEEPATPPTPASPVPAIPKSPE